MPELPEVQTVVDSLRPRVEGRTIDSVEHLRDDMIQPRGFDLRAALRARTVTFITRRAKRIVFQLDDGNRFYIHLEMSGRLTVERDDAAIEKHTHLIVQLRGSRQQIRFKAPRRFGGIFWIGATGDSSED